MLQTIYHELSNEDKRDLESLKKLGLCSRLENLRRKALLNAISFERWVDSIADKFLPSHLKSKGFSRLASVFAWPHIPKNGARILELFIDREEGLVLPHDCYTSAVDLGKVNNLFIRRYWEEALLLKDFLNSYSFRPFGETDNYVWQDANGFPYTQPEIIILPEKIREVREMLPYAIETGL